MLVLTRRIGERILIAQCITVIVEAIEEGKILLGIEADRDVKVCRKELLDRQVKPPHRK